MHVGRDGTYYNRNDITSNIIYTIWATIFFRKQIVNMKEQLGNLTLQMSRGYKLDFVLNCLS